VDGLDSPKDSTPRGGSLRSFGGGIASAATTGKRTKFLEEGGGRATGPGLLREWKSKNLRGRTVISPYSGT